MNNPLLDPSLHRQLQARCGGQYLILNFGGGRLKQIINPKQNAPRHTASLRMIYKLDQHGVLPDGTLILNTSDLPIVRVNEADVFEYPVLSYSTSPEYIDRVLPDFIFDGWPEAGLASYQILYDRLKGLNTTNWDERLPYVYWSGSATNSIRQACIDRFRKDPRVSFHLIQGSKNLTKENTATPKGYAPFQAVDHFKYLLDLPGNGYSGRAKLLLLTGGFLVRFTHQLRLTEYWEDNCPELAYEVIEQLDDLEKFLDRISEDEAAFRERADWAQLWARYMFHPKTVALAMFKVIEKALLS